MTKIELEKNLKTINDVLEIQIDSNDIDAVEGKLTMLSNVMGLSANCMRYAKQFVLIRQKHLLDHPDVSGMIPSKLKTWLEGQMHEELATEKHCDRLNAAIVHCSDSLISVISRWKKDVDISLRGASVPNG